MPDKSFSFLDGVSLFFGGGLSSWLIAHIYYRKQKHEAAKDSRDITVFIYQLWKQGARLDEFLAAARQRLDELPQRNEKDIEREFLSYNARLLDRGILKDPEDYITTTLTWKALADQIAESRAVHSDLHILDQIGHITQDSLLRAHRDMFPTEYRWAGTWRDAFISIQRAFTPVTESNLAAMSSITITPVPPDRISDSLERLLERWNRNVADYKGTPVRSLASTLARFHHEFLVIHPFFDGNGRIARALLREQIIFLTGRDMKPFTDREAYYQALHASDAGQTDALSHYIESHVQ